ncbi:MAG: creatininase family protein [candidate division Zixibacteria bacterium]|nr:creatininase family protein [candidate division Zixibacteria bacterium]
MPVYWEDLNWAEFQRRVPEEFRTAILPVGTIEAHGVGPLGTDNFIPTDLVAEIASDLSALICPPVHYGQVRGLAGYPGSIAVDEDVFTLYCTSIFKSVAAWGLDNLVVINGHGGNTQSLKKAAWVAHEQTGIKMLVVDWWILATPVCEQVYGQAGGHAGTDENGYILAIRPDTVHANWYSPEMLYEVESAVTAYPIPGPVITYKPGEGAPDFDPQKAQAYRTGAIEKVRSYCHGVLAQWESMGL